MTSGGGSTSRWPTGTEYSASVQQPSTSFADEELRKAQLTLTTLGLPAMASGQNAVAFHMEAANRPVAVRCLLHPNDDGRLRYKALQEHVRAGSVPAVVSAAWLDEGIRVHGRWWPVVVMPWVSGAPLHAAIERRLGDPARISRLADRWLDLVEVLQDKQFGHGDYQHGNVLLTDDDEFQLVDLDGIWVPGMGVGAPNEHGHPNYQHVNRSDTDWGPHVDTFSAVVIAVSMLALGADPGLARFMTGENLLFSKADFAAPGHTAIWQSLAASADHDVSDLADRLLAMARSGRPPSMSVREVLDASFDPASLLDEDGDSEPTGPLPAASPAAAGWWTDDRSGEAILAESPDDGYWNAGRAVVAAQPAAAGAPGSAPPGPAGAVASFAGVAPISAPAPHAQTVQFAPVAHLAPAPQQAAPPPQRVSPAPPSQSFGLARITGQPVLAGLISGATAGLIGSLLAGVLQSFSPDVRVDGGIFVGMIAGMLGGMVHAWSALNLVNYGMAVRRFLIGATVGLLAGIVAVAIADLMSRSTLEIGDTSNVALVAYVWGLTAALVGLAVGLLRSPKAGAYAFTGGAIVGFLGGLVHGATSAEFERRALRVSGFDWDVLVIATFVAMLIGLIIAVAIRTARHGSLTVVGGQGHGAVIEFHSSRVTLGGGIRDTLPIRGHGLGPSAIRLEVGDDRALVSSDVVVSVDGVAQPPTFTMMSGQVVGYGNVFVRLDTKHSAGSGGPT